MWITHDINLIINEPTKGTTEINMKVDRKLSPSGPSKLTTDLLITLSTSFLRVL
jgi:hypothetical protein